MPDPDLEIRGARSFRRGGGGLQKKFFSALRPHFGLKIRGWGGAGPLSPSPGSATGGDAPLRNGVTDW